MTNKEAREQLQVLYGCRCLLTGIKTDKLQYHHILKKEYGGNATVSNGANLIDEIHKWVHSLENIDTELFWLVNESLDLYKQCLDLGHTELINQYESEVMPEALKRIRGTRR